MFRCRYCHKRCTFIGDQPGALQRFGRRMELWICSDCGTTHSRLRAPRPSQLVHTRGRAGAAHRQPAFRLRVASVVGPHGLVRARLGARTNTSR